MYVLVILKNLKIIGLFNSLLLKFRLLLVVKLT